MMKNNNNNNNKEYINKKIIDGLLGFAVGDALGVPVEFKSREYLNENYVKDMIGYGSHMVPEGTWSDDTSLTIATMDSIYETGLLDYNDIMSKFSKWCLSSKYTATDNVFDIGITTRNAIQRFLNGTDALNCGDVGIRQNGNGSLMRMLPFVYYIYMNNFSEIEKVKIINDASSITHAHEISRMGCNIYLDYLILILNGYDKESAFNKLSEINYNKYYSNDTVKYYNRILSGNLKNLNVSEIKSSGYVVYSLEASIWCTITSTSFEEAVCKAVNLGDDTDTIGAITGSICGIIYGIENIPNKWINTIKKKEYLEEIANNYYTTLTQKKYNIFNRMFGNNKKIK